ncbi:Pleckstrin homology domain-domain-containing protein [Clohesyomyces aquaticus]|uniref:Pleckstrin homology domain-domain-containing protein n=1 Tax=Clohesyomyces aquaticus TaxID=1231657 RepID=A0A1Y1ZZ87_9PLEO|nr:Pleckstrin homology domain-domain-containing protein [Clohesyomyces aquaticus]
MAEEQKPAVTTEAGVVAPTPAPAETLVADKPAEAVVPTVEEPKTEAVAEAAAPAEEQKEEKKEEKAEEKPVEPIYSGALGYKAPGLKNAFRFSKKYFWFGEDEPVSTQSLSHYLRGEKADVAHPTAAWSSVTGKGLLYFVKHADQKETPAGVLNLADATDVTKDGTVAFFFKLHGHKHTFEAQTSPERNGWFVAVEKAVEEAKAKKEEIVNSESYKEQLEKLGSLTSSEGKPAALVATAAKEGSTPKKSTDAKAVEPEAAPVAEGAVVPARTGSSSSSSDDEEKKKKKASKSKSRSVSRGKRASIFGGFLGKKEKAEEKKEEKKEEEAKKEGEETAAPVAEASTAAPVLTEEAAKPVEEPKVEEPVVPAAEPTAEEKKVEKPKPTKRGSIFGNFVEKLKSPTTEKKEADLVPAPVAKEAEAPAVTEAPKVEEPVVPVTDGAAEAPKEETKPTTPHKEGNFFGKFLSGHKEKAKTPTTEAAPKIEEPAKVEETPVVAAAEPVTEAPKEEEKKEEGVTTAVSSTPTATKKRGSIFGNVGSKKEGESSDKPKGLAGLFRNASKSIKPSKKEKEAAPAPAKVEETAEPKEEAPVVPVKEEAAAPTPAAQPASIGDVVGEAVTVGQAPKSTTEVSATA